MVVDVLYDLRSNFTGLPRWQYGAIRVVHNLSLGETFSITEDLMFSHLYNASYSGPVRTSDYYSLREYNQSVP